MIGTGGRAYPCVDELPYPSRTLGCSPHQMTLRLGFSCGAYPRETVAIADPRLKLLVFGAMRSGARSPEVGETTKVMSVPS